MSKFLRKILIFVLCIVVCMNSFVLLHYFVIGSQYEHNYQASLLDKLDRLQSIASPKIILCGNSNLAFGINSAMIEEAFDMPVVNLGLHGGMGNAFHERIPRTNINEGDVVIICHTSYADSGEISDLPLAWVTYDFNRELLPLFNVKDRISMLMSYPDYFKSSLRRYLLNQAPESPPYSREAFNEYGDVVVKPEACRLSTEALFSNGSISTPKINTVCTDRLNELYSYCQKRGARMVVAAYPIAYGEYSKFSDKDFIQFQTELDSYLDCDIISDFTDYFFPYEYFFDTAFHLTEEGAELRTLQLISDLEAYFTPEG